MNLAWDVGSITIYGFICHLPCLQESSFFNMGAALILSHPLCHIEGAYQTALFHAKKASELDPENLDYLKYILFFYDLPDKIMQKEEAIEIARKVLQKDPKYQIAKEVLEKYNVRQ